MRGAVEGPFQASMEQIPANAIGGSVPAFRCFLPPRPCRSTSSTGRRDNQPVDNRTVCLPMPSSTQLVRPSLFRERNIVRILPSQNVRAGALSCRRMIVARGPWFIKTNSIATCCSGKAVKTERQAATVSETGRPTAAPPPRQRRPFSFPPPVKNFASWSACPRRRRGMLDLVIKVGGLKGLPLSERNRAVGVCFRDELPGS